MSAKVSAQKARLGLREKTKLPAARQSTPDSEALASSDDDLDRIGHMQATTRPVRRSSWLNDIRPTRLSGPGSGSQPTTPSAEADTWLPQHNTYWQSQSTTSSRALDESPIASPTSYNDTSLPFEFPLQPTRKTFRSASYSVGQLGDEAEAQEIPQSSANPPPSYRPAGAGLFHRPSRPSQLNASWGLSRLREDDDGMEEDDIALSGSRNGLPPETSSSRLLKQAATEHARLRQRTFTAPQIPSPDSSFEASRQASAAAEREEAMRQDHAANAISSSMHSGWNNNALASPRSLVNPHTFDTPHTSYTTADDLYAEGHRRAQWQSQLGFGNVGEGHQSRRHSFADISLRTRQASLNHIYPEAVDEEINELYPTTSHRSDPEEQQYADMGAYNNHQLQKPLYFGGHSMAQPLHTLTSTAMGDSYPQATALNPYEVPQSITRTTRHLYVVAFKCARSEIYYIPGSTGLVVNAGDMVIVDGDRGWDLGTVTAADVSMDDARRLRERAAEEHYHWLMLFSRHNQQGGGISGPPNMAQQGNPMVPPSMSSGGPMPAGGPMSAGGSMRRPEAPHAEHDSKVRMIKRLAISHEIHTLREKEGSEAKAKRICQAKVAEHGLAMEILDAEYQADWKKLTFFYYADHYVNFNDLVSDLFKIFKTRIWMASINPAAAPSPDPFTSYVSAQPPPMRGRGRNGSVGPAWANMVAATMGPSMSPYGAPASIPALPSHTAGPGPQNRAPLPPMSPWPHGGPPGLYDPTPAPYNVPIGTRYGLPNPISAGPQSGHEQTPEAFELGLQALSFQAGGPHEGGRIDG